MSFEQRQYISGQILSADDMNNIISGITPHNPCPIESFDFSGCDSEDAIQDLLKKHKYNEKAQFTRQNLSLVPTSSGYVTFKATGADPYINFYGSSTQWFDGTTTFESAASDMRYIILKYRARDTTLANMDTITGTINAFVAADGGASYFAWGQPGTCISWEVQLDNEWHHAFFDATAAWGDSRAQKLTNFRIDPFNKAGNDSFSFAGYEMDIEYIHFFSSKQDANKYIELDSYKTEQEDYGVDGNFIFAVGNKYYTGTENIPVMEFKGCLQNFSMSKSTSRGACELFAFLGEDEQIYPKPYIEPALQKTWAEFLESNCESYLYEEKKFLYTLFDPTKSKKGIYLKGWFAVKEATDIELSCIIKDRNYNIIYTIPTTCICDAEPNMTKKQELIEQGVLVPTDTDDLSSTDIYTYSIEISFVNQLGEELLDWSLCSLLIEANVGFTKNDTRESRNIHLPNIRYWRGCNYVEMDKEDYYVPLDNGRNYLCLPDYVKENGKQIEALFTSHYKATGLFFIAKYPYKEVRIVDGFNGHTLRMINNKTILKPRPPRGKGGI